MTKGSFCAIICQVMDIKKKTLIKKIALIAATVLLIAGGGVYLYVQSIFDKIQVIDKDSEVQIPSEYVKFLAAMDNDAEDSDIFAEPSADAVDPVGSPSSAKASTEPDLNNANIKLVKDSKVTNILLIGSDSRTSSMRGRSDSIIILSINRNTNKINMVSVLRDTYVEIPGYQNNKINAAYAYGGTKLLDKTIEKNLGVHIDYNVCINFDGFIKAFTKIGNIDISLNKDEVNYLNNTVSYGKWKLKVGVNSLTPEQTLAYARARHVGNSDWGRTERQRKVLSKAFDKCRSQGLSSMLSMVDSVAPYVSTDMSKSVMVSLIKEVVNGGMTISNTKSVPTSGMFQSKNIRGMSALVPDLAKVSKAVHQALYGVD